MQMLGQFPEDVGIALSGGVDSMVLLDFLMRGKRNVTIYHFHHGTDHADDAFDFVHNVSEALNVPLVLGKLQQEVPDGRSKEDFWREQRYNFLDEHSTECPILLAHHLDDVLETWLFSAFHGVPKVVPYARNRCYRPMLQVKKEQILEWAEQKGVAFIQDPSNENTGYMRNKIRHEVVPKVLEVNPGIYKVLAKKVRAYYNDWVSKSTGVYQ